MEQRIVVLRKQMVRVRDRENPKDTAEKSCEAEGKCPVYTGKGSLAQTLCRLALILTDACRSAQESFTSKLDHHFLVVQYVPVLSLEHVVVAMLQILQHHLEILH